MGSAGISGCGIACGHVRCVEEGEEFAVCFDSGNGAEEREWRIWQRFTCG
jgi:hypothetical protein